MSLIRKHSPKKKITSFLMSPYRKHSPKTNIYTINHVIYSQTHKHALKKNIISSYSHNSSSHVCSTRS